MFLRAIEKGRLGHAYALVGEEGIGKTTFALDLANAMGTDPIFDLYLYDSSFALSIEEARNLEGRLSLTPVGAFKVAIVAQAEQMTLQAANALLKTLEEPPARSIIILVTANFYVLLPTIASRVQRVNFGLAPVAQVRDSLESFNLDEETLEEILGFASGRIGLARRLAAEPGLLQFYRQAKRDYQILEKGTLVERLQTAERLATTEPPDINEFLKFAMQEWGKKAQNSSLSRKLFKTWEDLKFNLNLRLLLDNLFLP